MPVFPIPDDWDGDDWACVIIEWPNSPQYMGLLRGLVTTPVRGRFWDGRTGSITDAQTVGLEIQERNPVTSCDEIVVALDGIKASIDLLDVNATLQIAIQTNIETNISNVATAVADSLAEQTTLMIAQNIASSSAEATAMAWSESFAQNLIGVEIINNQEAQFRPIEVGVDPPPQTEEATPTGITPSLESDTTLLICQRAYWLVRNFQLFINYVEAARQSWADTVLGIMGVVASGLWVAALKAEIASKRFLIPAAVLIGFAHNLLKLIDSEAINPVTDLNDWVNDNFSGIVCGIACDMGNEERTEKIQNEILANAIGFGLSPNVASLSLLFFNYSSLAALYYVSPILDPAPLLPPPVTIAICEGCCE